MDESQITAAISAQLERAQRGLIVKIVGGVIGGVGLPLIVAAVLGVLGWYAQSKAIEASTDLRVRAVETRMERIEAQLEAIDGVRREVTGLSTRVDAWRQSDAATRTVEQRELERRLGRIEDAIDRRPSSARN